MRKVFTLLFILFLLIAWGNISWGSEKGETMSPERESIKEHEIPFLYYFQWIALLSILMISLLFVYLKPLHREERKELAYILTFLTLLAYSLNYHPQIKEYLEMESPLLGIVKFLLTLANGALLTYYGVLGRHLEHEEIHEEVTPHEH